MNDYERIAQTIRWLDRQHQAQPSLEQLAEAAGLSASHFHRLFQRWAGITPKDFLQCLTAQFAKERLRASASVLETALAAGLSGPGRLHDLFVTLEAASPGEWKNRGSGLKIRWGCGETPFGRASVGWSDRGLCHLAFLDADSVDEEPAGLSENWAAAVRLRDDAAAQRQCDAVFRAADRRERFKAHVGGTAFQVKVWRALLCIPSGCVASYGQIARSIGAPAAVRAVGTACGQNAVAFLIPCHRVIRETGVVQGYRWGSERKRALLAWEAGHLDEPLIPANRR